MSKMKLVFVVALLLAGIVASVPISAAVTVVSSDAWDANYTADKTVNGVWKTSDMGMVNPGGWVIYDLGANRNVRKMRITPPCYGGGTGQIMNPTSGTVEFSNDQFNWTEPIAWSAPPLESGGGYVDYSECALDRADSTMYRYVRWTITSGGRVGEVWFIYGYGITKTQIAVWESDQNATYSDIYPMWQSADGVYETLGVHTGDPGGLGMPYVTYDLGVSKEIYGINIFAPNWYDHNPTSGEVWVSDSPTSGYVKQGDFTMPNMHWLANANSFLPHAHGRYVQLRNLVGDQWTEFNVITGPANNIVDSWSGEFWNGWDRDCLPYYTADGIYGTDNMAMPNQANAWIVYDFGSPTKVSKMRIYSVRYGGAVSETFNPTSGTLEFSDDKVNWTAQINWIMPQLETTGYADWAETALPQPMTYRYVRLTFTDANCRIGEVVFPSSSTLAVWENNQNLYDVLHYPAWKTADGVYIDSESYGSVAGDPTRAYGSGELTYDLGSSKLVYGFAFTARSLDGLNPTAGSLWVSDNPLDEYSYVKVGDWTMPALAANTTGVIDLGINNAKLGRYIEIRGLDSTYGGSWNETSILCPTTGDPSNIPDVKTSADGVVVSIQGSVTADFGNYIYVESSNRSSGIRVCKENHGVSVGQVVTVMGTMVTLASGERCVQATTITPTGVVESVLPLGLNNKALGGGDLGTPAQGTGQVGVANGAGLNNIGLLVTAWGKLTSLGGNRYSLEDGSGVTVTVEVLNGSITGSPYASITGIMSSEKVNGDVVRLILVKDASSNIKTY